MEIDSKHIRKLVPIEWPDEDVAVYANNMIAFTDGVGVYLTFCQTQPPAIVGTDEEKKGQLDALKSVKARSVARLVVPVGVARQIIEALQTQVAAVDAKVKATSSE